MTHFYHSTESRLINGTHPSEQGGTLQQALDMLTSQERELLNKSKHLQQSPAQTQSRQSITTNAS